MGDCLTCVDKVKVKNRIVSYKLVDEYGEYKEYTRDEVYDILFNKKAYIQNLRLTQNNRIIQLKYEVNQDIKDRHRIDERKADQIQSNLIGVIVNLIQCNLCCNVSYWKIQENREGNLINKEYFVYTGKAINMSSRVGKEIINKKLTSAIQNAHSPWKNLNMHVLNEVGFIIKTKYTVNRLNNNIENISTTVYMTVPGSIDPIEIDGTALMFEIQDVRDTKSIYISSNIRSLLQYLNK